MLRFTSTYPRATQVLEEYRRWVLAQSKANLTKSKKNASGDLHRSIKGYIKKRFNRSEGGQFTGGTELPSLRFEMNHYGAFLDEGVKGSDTTYAKSMGSPYKFSGKYSSVPTKPIERWLSARGKDQKLAYVVARSIYRKGIEATKFFSKPFDSRYPKMVNEYHVAVADDIANNLAYQLKKQLSKKDNLTAQ